MKRARKSKRLARLYVIANPEIVWTSTAVVDGIEGCLSIPGYLGEVERYEAIRVRALDRHGKKIKLRLEGWTGAYFSARDRPSQRRSLY